MFKKPEQKQKVANILLVDDVSENIFALEKLLAGEGRNFLKATSGKAALKLAYSNDIALILLDVQMPEMNGFEVMNELKDMQGFTTTPVIMLTANETMEDVFKLEGVRAYFVKPVDIPKLLSKIRECLGENPL